MTMTESTVRVGSNGRISGYVGYALKVIGEKAEASVTIRGAGNALGKAVSVAEIVKRKCPRPLHQVTSLDYVELPARAEGGEKEGETKNRKVPVIEIVLSTEKPKEFAAAAAGTSSMAPPGYQPPISDSERSIVGDKRK